MALERSVLTCDGIAALLQAEYGRRVCAVRRLALGSANCYAVDTEVGRYFLKEFQSFFGEEELVREVRLVNFLAAKQFPVARFLLTKGGAPFCKVEGHMVAVEEFIEGKGYGYDDFPATLLPDMARTLGRMHAVLREYSLPEDLGEEWLASYSAEKMARQYADIRKLAEERTEDPYRKQIAEDLRWKEAMAFRCEGYKKYFEGLTYSATHGDFQGCQLICDADRVKAVIDFSGAKKIPVVWEIMRSYVQTSAAGRLEARVDLPGLCEYVGEYRREFPLSEADLRGMPYVYLFQLARSKFGYKQYLTTDSEDREGLIRFAFWRTSLCKELEERGEEISRALVDL